MKRIGIMLAAWLATGTVVNADESRPNFLLLLVDDLGRQDVGIYGSDLYETPNIDRLATEGMRFDNAYAAHPRCVPSRAGFLSGRYPARFGVPGFVAPEANGHALPLSAVSFGEALQAAGYRTGYVGKWHLGKEGGGPDQQGFDVSIMAGSSGAPPSHFLPYEVKANGSDSKGFEPYDDGPEGEYLTDRLTDEAIGFMESSGEEPFLLVLAHYAVHTPIQAPDALTDKYRNRLAAMGRAEGGPRGDSDVMVDGTGEVKTSQNHPVYAAMVESVDQNLGRLLDKLDSLGLTENTVIILTSDHGGLSSRGLGNRRELATSNLPFRHGKGWLYEGGIRVPLLVRWPGHIEPGSVSEHQVTGTDHFPTLLELAGLPLQPDQHLDGRSYSSALAGENYQRDPMFWHSALGRPEQTGDTRSSAVIRGPWKLIQWYALESGAILRSELFNLAEDPGEQSDVAVLRPDKVAELTGLLETWKASVNARLGEFKRGGI